MWRAPSQSRRATPRIVIIGGGIAGLAAAHRLGELSRAGHRSLDIKLFEANPRLGGTIATEHCDGFLIESGPDSFVSEKPSALRLCERLGITGRLLGTREGFRRTYVVRASRLHPLPEGFLLLAPTRIWPVATSPLFSWPGKARMALDLVLPRRVSTEDESLGAFVTRRFGREALERVAQPLAGGVYTADPDRLSLAATMPRFQEMERRHRSIIRAMRRQGRRAKAGSGARWSLFVTLDDGMQTLVDILEKRLPPGALHLSTAVHELRQDPRGTWVINGNVESDAVILAAPAHVAARLLDPVDSSLAKELQGISYASSATVTLAYRREDIPHPLDGFGFVVPQAERRSILACTFSSIKYDKRATGEFVLMRVFVGGELQPELAADEDRTLEANARRELADLLGVTAPPILKRIHRHADAMPIYHVGHLDRLARIEECLRGLPGLKLAGSAYRGVGIPDCVHTGETAAGAVMKILGPADAAPHS